jgi:hypothetical protein
MQNEKKLLNEVSEKLRNFEESQKKEGGIFNIFSITKIERREVDTHSAMIAELLNPRGRHGQDDKFLIQFLKTVIPECEFSETNSASVFKEKSFNSLGRVDILIILDDHVFVIENKIDAEDGEKQLERYKKILETYNNKKRHLIYLTIDGSEAEKYSLGSVKDNEYRRISYENHILNWLDSCIEISNTLPKLEYALRQYQDIIKKITGKSMTNNLKNELVELLLEEGNFESAQKISSVITLAKGKILFNFLEKLLKIDSAIAIPSELLSNELEKLTYDEIKCQNWFSSSSKEKSHNIGIFFDIGISNFLFRIDFATQAMYYGLVPVEKDDNGKYEPKKNWDQVTFGYFEKANWSKLKWFTIPINKSYQVKNNIELIRGENAKNLILKIKNEIDFLINFSKKMNE